MPSTQAPHVSHYIEKIGRHHPYKEGKKRRGFPISLISYYEKAFKTLSGHWDGLFKQKPSVENPYVAEMAAFQGELAILSEFEEWASEFQAFEYSAPFFFKGPKDFVVAGRDRCPPALTTL